MIDDDSYLPRWEQEGLESCDDRGGMEKDTGARVWLPSKLPDKQTAIPIPTKKSYGTANRVSYMYAGQIIIATQKQQAKGWTTGGN